MDEHALTEGDASVIQALREHGDKDLSLPRHTIMFFYPYKKSLLGLGQKRKFQTIAESAAKLGWKATALTKNKLILENEVPVDEASVAVRTAWANKLAADLGVEFDGWECAILGD